MGKYNKTQKDTQQQPNHKRFCRVCHKVSYQWSCCGQRTARLNVNMNKPEFKQK